MADPAPPEAEQPGGSGRPFTSRLARRLVPGVVRRSYALKFVLALLVVVVLVAGIGVVSYVQIQGIIEDDAEETLRSASVVQSDVLDEWISNVERQTRGAATANVYRTDDPERIRDHLRDSRAMGQPDVAEIHYVDPDAGEVHVSTDPDAEGRSTASVPAWREPIERATSAPADGDAVASSDRAYEDDGRLLTAFAHRVSNGEGVLIVVADVRQALNRHPDSETIATTRVLNADGYEVDAQRQQRRSSLAETSAFETARKGGTAVHDHESDVVAYAPVDGTDWIVVAEAPKADLYEASETVGRNVTFLVVSTIVVLAAVGIVLGRGTVLPLIRLRERTRELESGTFDVDLRIDREDEIGRLFDSFAQMRDSLREQIRETEAAQERAERRRREVEVKNERLEQFASTVSHDLRNPLNVAEGYRELLSTEATADDPDVELLREYASQIDTSHDRMGTIIDDVLALAREGQNIDDPVEVDLESVATDAWSNVEHGAATLEVVGDRTFEADRARLLRAFENLFRNAVEHGSTSPPSQAQEDAVDHSGEGVAVEVGPTETGFYVADDGPGIPPEDANEVFDYGKTTSEDGTGFGLAIVEAIVAAHGWTIGIDEAFDDGAKFVVSGVVEERANDGIGEERTDDDIGEERASDEDERVPSADG